MEIVKTIHEVRQRVRAARQGGDRIGFVPTMGYLHEGHTSLVKIARENSDYVVMSIFVNRIQFNDSKDFTAYPRELERDAGIAEAAGVDILFAPDEDEMYKNRLTYIDMELLADNLCGSKRPGHFRGVYTVVAKFFNIVQPDIALFGQKDIQQAVTIEKMVFDLNFPLKVIIAPTIREGDGLAKSSRNKYLNEDERARSVAIYKSLLVAQDMLISGERSSEKILDAMKAELMQGKPDSIDYISAVSYDRLAPVNTVSSKSVIAVAAFFGRARLIDNMIIEFDNGRVKCVF